MRLRARYVVPVDGPMIENGAVAVERGRIVSVEAAGTFASGDTDFGDAVICPGFVNAHTHLELTDLAGEIEPRDSLVEWLSQLVAARRQSPPDMPQVQAAVRDGVRQSLAAGVTCIGDITTAAAWTREVLTDSLPCGVSYGEVIAIGTLREESSERIACAMAGPDRPSRWRWGLSPHAPYTVEPEVMRACATQAQRRRWPISIHLAETPDETAFTHSLEGPLADHLKRLGVWDDRIAPAGCTPVELVDGAGLLGETTVIAHGNYLDDADIARLAHRGASVAYCPRTHAAFGHAAHPFRALQAAGVNVCVGTDSLASNPSLSVLDELRFLHRRHPDVPAQTLLAMGTLHGAMALGISGECGSLTAGKAADLAVAPLAPGDSWDAMLLRDDSPLAVFVAGSRLT